MKLRYTLILAVLVIAGCGNPTEFGASPQAAGRVVFDLSKNNDAGNADWRIDGAYSDWADALHTEGYQVTQITGTINSAALSGASVYIIPEPQQPFSDSERQAIADFVQKGGGLLMISDHRISDRNNNGWDSPEVFNGWDGKTPASVASHLQAGLDSDGLFGITHSFRSSYSDPVYTATPVASHPVLQGVGQAGVYVGTSLELSGSARALMASGGKTYLASSSYGSGRVLAWGDSSTFGDDTYSDGSTGKYNDWVLLDNAQLGLNMVRWLAGDL
jgi:hypothetical protein